MSARVLVGTCSWADKSLIDSGRFYPRKTMASADRLAFYAGRFRFVEVDSSYYAVPAPEMVRGWAAATPPNFVFDIKAYGLLTQHPVQPQTLPPSVRGLAPPARGRVTFAGAPQELRDAVWDAFRTAVAPLAEAGKLGVLVFQFPPWFQRDAGHQRYLGHVAENAAPHRVAVEFRNHTWLEDPDTQRETFALLRDHGLCYVAVDEPQGFPSSLPPVLEATGPVAVVRLHGRNRATWERSGPTASDRFDYSYTAEELGEWVPRVEGLAEAGIEVHMSMNTNKADQGPVNAQLLLSLLHHHLPAAGPGAPPPTALRDEPPQGQLPLFG